MAVATKRKRSDHVKSIAHGLWSEKTTWSPLLRHLQRQVANAFVLYVNYKHYHWQTYGPVFRDLHLSFDEFANEVLDNIDHLAERIHMIGQDSPAHLIEAIDLASVSAAALHSTLRDMVEEADRNLLVVLKEMREAARVADAHGDLGTVDLASRFVQIYEKHEWWLRDVLRKRDGPQLV
jgi:starvation-inducible DNA-binding protein